MIEGPPIKARPAAIVMMLNQKKVIWVGVTLIFAKNGDSLAASGYIR
tara:strand:+ start:233 stop:373 length:141 start_codon:yes stop_codon:yes gene_type:complete